MDRKKRIQHEMNKLISVVLVLLLVDSTFVVFDGNFTGNVVKESEGVTYLIPQINEVDSIKELSSFNEGFYLVKEGYVFYVESAASYIPLYIKVNDIQQQNGMISIDEDGTMEFDGSYRYKGLAEEIPEVEENLVTADAIALEKITGFAPVVTTPQSTSRSRAIIREADKKLISSCIKQGCNDRTMKIMLAHVDVENNPRDYDAKDYPLIPLIGSDGKPVVKNGKEVKIKDTSKEPTSFGILQQGPDFIRNYNPNGQKAVDSIKDCGNQKQQCVDNAVLAFKAFEEKRFNEWEGMSDLKRADWGSYEAFTAIKYNAGDRALPTSAPVHKERVEAAYDKFAANNYYGNLVAELQVSDATIAQASIISGPAAKDVIAPIQQLYKKWTSSSVNGIEVEGSKFYVDSTGKLLVEATGPDYAVLNQNGKLVINDWGSNTPLSPIQVAALKDFAPAATNNLLLVPRFQLSDGTDYYLQPGDKATRQENDVFVEYEARKDTKGYTYLQALDKNGDFIKDKV